MATYNEDDVLGLTEKSEDERLAEALGVSAEDIEDCTSDALENIVTEEEEEDISGDDFYFTEEEEELGVVNMDEEEEEDEELLPEYELGHVVELKFPITITKGAQSRTITEIKFGKVLTAGKIDKLPMVEMKDITWGYALQVIHLCTGVPLKILRRLVSADQIALTKVAMSFLGAGYKTR